MNVEQQATATRIWAAVVNIDLQLYKGSIYKLRWGSPGGLDEAIPAYDEARRTVEETDWPASLGDTADDLAERIRTYIETLKVQDVTSASAQHSRMIKVFEALRDGVRVWPDGVSGNGADSNSS